MKRFHDTYHNEAVVGKVGLVNKPFADRLMLTFTYSQNDKEIQNGVVQEIVYGQKRRKGHSFMPSVEYRKRNLLLKGLDVNLTANYNRNITQNIDTATYEYNWLGQMRYKKVSWASRVIKTINQVPITGMVPLLPIIIWVKAMLSCLIMC